MSGEVRLWRHNYDTDFRARHLMLSDDDAQRAGITPYIALPLARHAALMRVVEAAVKWGQHNAGWVVGDVESILPSKQLMGAVDAYLATAPSRQGEAPRE